MGHDVAANGLLRIGVEHPGSAVNLRNHLVCYHNRNSELAKYVKQKTETNKQNKQNKSLLSVGACLLLLLLANLISQSQQVAQETG